MKSYKDQFSLSVGAPGAPLHFAAHSHHPWPDVTLDAQEESWRDAARLLDRKWGYIFDEVRPEAQAHVARILNLSDPGCVTFSPNTHDFVCRILSSLPLEAPLTILTTDGEFHSFARQAARLEEEGLAQITRVPVEPFETLPRRLVEAAGAADYHLAYISQAFFNSGFTLQVAELEAVARAFVSPETVFVVDGYHSFMANSVDWAPLETRAFFLAGGYKYAMAGEGVCFIHAPPGYCPRPRLTGWYAAFSALSDAQDGVPYAETGARLDGATYDVSGLYRFNAVQRWLEDEGLDVAGVNDHVAPLKNLFLDLINERSTALDPNTLLLDPAGGRIGRFLTFRTQKARYLYDALEDLDVITDVRGDRLRIGFGLYHDPKDVHSLVGHLARIH